jgi:hypothetical protein
MTTSTITDRRRHRSITGTGALGSPSYEEGHYDGIVAFPHLKTGTLKTYRGFPHGMPTTEAESNQLLPHSVAIEPGVRVRAAAANR